MLQTHPFYIDHHPNTRSLDGNWFFGFSDNVTETPVFPYNCSIPASAFRNLQDAGLLPDPYVGCNSKQYRDADKHIYYYQKSFQIENIGEDKDVFLCFDGVGYESRVWLNGTLLCEHEGMFGGPVCEVSAYILSGENVLTVEVRAPGHNQDPAHEKQIVPWNICRDSTTSNGDFTVFGIWRSVRLEIVSRYHLSRPYLYTDTVTKEYAQLQFEVEIADPQIRELETCSHAFPACACDQVEYDFGLGLHETDKHLYVAVTLCDKGTGAVVYCESEEVVLYDKRKMMREIRRYECQFFEKTITVHNPKLWQPNGFGEANLYTVKVELSNDIEVLDCLTFDTGIRTIEYTRAHSPRRLTCWEEYQFIINGRPTFIRGMNWQPADFLYNVSDADYRWLLDLVKNAGIMLLRVWSGGGMPEDDRFYRLCDERGIMVMQDSFIANQATAQWNRAVLRSQESQTLYRIRNHPSLTVHTGGNEFNPYHEGNDAAMWVISQTIKVLDPSRKFYCTSPDGGSAHIYRDMEPVWYRKLYRDIPFLTESGIHSFPNAKSLRQLISKEEFEKPLDTIFTEEFKKTNPELHNHFSEFIPQRIPRMMSRASMITPIRNISLSELCEATQIASCEFYGIMANAMRENFPRTCGLLPWVFNRPWTTTAIQLVDGLADPIAPYYYLKNAYAPLCIELALNEVTYAPEETILLTLRLINDEMTTRESLRVSYCIYSPTLTCAAEETFETAASPERYLTVFEASAFTIPAEWAERYFFVHVSASDVCGILHQSTYWCKVLSALQSEEARAKYRAQPQNNIYFENGPFLKPQIAALHEVNALKAVLLSSDVNAYDSDRVADIKLHLSNTGSRPLFPIRLNTDEAKTVVYAEDNFFFLESGCERTIFMQVRLKDIATESLTVRISAWNTEDTVILVSLNDNGSMNECQ